MISAILSSICYTLAVVALVFALLVHTVNNAKGIGNTVWNWKVNLYSSLFAAAMVILGVII